MMKKFLNAILLLALLPMSLLAQSVEFQQVKQTMEHNTQLTGSSYMFPAKLPAEMKPTQYSPLGAKYISILNSQGNPLRANYYLAKNTTPAVYEPKSNTHILAFRDIISTEEGQPFHLQSGRTGIIYSQDDGKSWSTPQIFDTWQSNFGINPSVGVANPTGSANPFDFSYFFYSRLARAEVGATSAPFVGAQYLFHTPESTDHFFLEGPGTNNPNTLQKWNINASMISYQRNNHDHVAFAGMLFTSTNVQYGHYGFSMIDLTNYDYNSRIPNAWEMSNFKQMIPVNDNSTYNSPIHIDSDPNGNLYAIVNNIFATDGDLRSVAFSKSTNNGAAWSDFTKMPKSIIENYALSLGLHKDSVAFAPFDDNAFVVYGVDQFSYFARMFIDMPHPIDNENHLIEVKYNSGDWSLTKVASFKSFQMFAVSIQKPYETSPDEDQQLFIYSNGFEVSAAKTLDGNLVVKWLDSRDEYYDFPATSIWYRFRLESGDDPRELLWGTDSPNQLQSNDIFMSYRKISENSWVTPRNVTDDVRYNRNTHMPKLLKNLRTIPVYQLRSNIEYLKGVDDEGNPYEPHYYDKDPFICEMANDFGFSFYVEVTMVDAIDPNSVETVVSDNNSISVFPNPVSNIANLNFQLEESGSVVIRINNALGQNVAEVVSDYFNAGTHNRQFDVSSLNQGTYYITMTINGKLVTKVMNIVK